MNLLRVGVLIKNYLKWLFSSFLTPFKTNIQKVLTLTEKYVNGNWFIVKMKFKSYIYIYLIF